jgi:hypothetical protein
MSTPAAASCDRRALRDPRTDAPARPPVAGAAKSGASAHGTSISGTGHGRPMPVSTLPGSH